MSKTPLGNVLMDSIRSLVISLLKLIAIVFAWLLKISGMILIKVSEAIEKNLTR